ncbi:MAG: SHOCT domain-containing protein [Actinobacteria bacterium]|nr:SHOCT domain-containing protein [Actinomycetota bacterium]
MPLLDLFFTMLMFFLLFLWIYLVIMTLMDVFRSDDLGGGAKALWVILIIILPLLGVLLYLIVRGRSMQERAQKDAATYEKAQRDYIRQAAGETSAADEIAKLAQLRDSGAITEAEYEQGKAKLLA